MIQTKLFRRHYAITAVVVVAFIGIGFIASNFIMRLAASRQAFGIGPGPQIFFAKLVDQTAAQSGNDRVRALKQVENLADRGLPFRFHLLSQDGKNLSDPDPIGLAWQEIKKPESAYEVTQVGASPEQKGPPGTPVFQDSLIRLPGSPAEYLYISHIDKDMRPLPPLPFFLATVGLLILSVLLGIGFALFLLFRSMTEKMALADNVIAELQSGNLKARFPIHRMDELGQAMLRFNKMADEIERLVDRLHSVEHSRVSLLQDLAHDLRTPIASLKNLLATIGKKTQEADQKIREELLFLSRKEVEYFERLVEDLLMLAQMSEPSYHGDRKLVSLAQILDEESESVFSRRNVDGKTVELKNDLRSDRFEITGDAHLMRRLFRNALDNALSFAKSKVTIEFLAPSSEEITVLIQDDGPGFSADALKGFGERRVSRAVERSNDGRLSVGLGSVIMRTVAEIHRGKLTAKNRTTPSGEVLGAEIRISIPRPRAITLQT
ncbi:MAG: ATP-binding protein [Oligoflexia bacterium]|nr:ATP-binding protein [Oligoflexia bacterium]